MADHVLLDHTPTRVLAVYAHPDDPYVSCGGTLARWAKEGSEVFVLVCTSGDKGTTDPDAVLERLVATRAQETMRASQAIAANDTHLLGHPDGELDEADLLREIVGWIRRLRPETVLCPDPTAVFFGEDYYNHRDHRVVGFATLDALAPAAALPHYFPDEGGPFQVKSALLSGTLEANVWVDISGTIDAKVAAVSCHASQFATDERWPGEAIRMRAEEEGRRATIGYAEGFRRLRLVG